MLFAGIVKQVGQQKQWNAAHDDHVIDDNILLNYSVLIDYGI